MDEGERTNMVEGVDTSLASERNDVFDDVWEAQPCVWDPE